MVDFTEKSRYGFDDLVLLVRLLRSPGGCPWDQAQTHRSIRRNFLEEALEACEALDEEDADHLREELGDVLLQVVFHAGIEADAGRFNVDDVCDGVCRKLIERHPHLFGRADERMEWEALKRAERGQKTVSQSMEGISKALPAAWRADKILSKAESSGLYEADRDAALAELRQASAELEEGSSGDAAEPPLGRALFALLELARRIGADPESALEKRCQEFITGFSQRETAAAEAAADKEKGKRLHHEQD